MKIGIMSDTHDRLDAVEKAIDLFNREKVEHVLHAGDLVSPFVAPKFAKLKAKLYIVWGNNDGDKEFIRVKFGEIGITPLGNFATLELDGKKIALLHGTHEEIVGALLRSGTFDVVVRGHNHRAEIREGKTLLINPGEVCGYLTERQTVAILNLTGLKAEILHL
ncbi:MAG: metallophosphoesterase [Candidatus Hadarchaeum sp.]|nr:metallophosphoesterase [Candidatus Hadarchaeum sp.]